MIDGIRRRRFDDRMHPTDRQNATQMVVGDHAKDKAGFQPPQTIAAQEEQQPDTSTAGPLLSDDDQGPIVMPTKRRSFKEWFSGLSKKKKIFLWVLVGLIVLGLAAASYFVFLHKTPAVTPVVTTQKQQAKEPPKPTTEPSKLTGLQVDPSVNQRPVTGVMIENSEFARPQSSLEHAGVVFEAIAEGGITRFLALYQDTQPVYIGPVRSVRPYYLQWLLGFDASVAHVGGSPEALQDIKTWGVKDLDQFANGSYYHRIGTREAPHNVYTSIAELNQIEAKKGYGASNYTGFLRKAEAPLKTPTVRSLDLRISSALFNVHYDYDQATNTYKRSEGGAPHMEVGQDGTQTQIAPKVVIALVLQQGIAADDLHTAYATLGSGHVYVFQDGNMIEGAWHKASNTEQLTFTDGNNNPIKLNPGQTWLTAVGGTDRVTYKP